MQARSPALLITKLNSALQYANNTCVIGAPNKIKDLEKTNMWVYEVAKDYNSRYSITISNRIFAVNPITDSKFNLTPKKIDLLVGCLITMQLKLGHCFDRARLIAKYLWEHSAGIERIEIVKTTTFDHVFVIINREGDLNNSNTWRHAWIIDAWYENNGIIYPAVHFNTKIKEIKEFADLQRREQKKINIIFNDDFLDGDEILELDCEIYPKLDRYPTYSISPFYPIEHYYTVTALPKGISAKLLEKDLEIHKDKFKKCAQELTDRPQKYVPLYSIFSKQLTDTKTHIHKVATKDNLNFLLTVMAVATDTAATFLRTYGSSRVILNNNKLSMFIAASSALCKLSITSSRLLHPQDTSFLAY
jgi:hypothetical protein